ncbi:MAG: SRPBCC family protein [Actinomycetota bacterium]|nr:SRPBCC family protein [Actinomycetota bacterium]
MSDISENSITIEAPISEVVAVLTDLASYPTWSTAIKSVEVQDKDADGRATKAKMSIDAGVMKDRAILDYDWSKAPAEISFALDDADLLTEMSGTYEITDNGDDTTTVKYQLTVALSMPVPAMMRQKAERATIDLALNQLKTKLEG